MNKLWKPALLSIAVIIMAIGMINSGAWWTDQAATQTQAITSGTLDLDGGGFTSFNLGDIVNMEPGDLTDEVTIIFKNTGNINLAWIGDLEVGDNVLKDVIYIDHAKMEFFSPQGATWEPTDEFIKDGKGVDIYHYYETLEDSDGYVTVAKFDKNNVWNTGLGNEFMGALKPGYLYKLTLRFGFKPTADNSYQAKGPLNLRINVNATQLKSEALNALGIVSPDMVWLNNQILKQTMP